MSLSIRFFRKKSKKRQSNRSNWIFYFPVVAIAWIAFLLYIPEIHLLLFGEGIPNVPIINLSDKINIILTFAIAFFAAVEGYSTHSLRVLEETRNRIEDARNELEKAYGPLYTLLNKFVPFAEEEKAFELYPEGKSELDNIMATYPFMFPFEIYDYWRKNVQKTLPIVGGTNLEPVGYKIYIEFRDLINKEYDRRVKEYNELLKK